MPKEAVLVTHINSHVFLESTMSALLKSLEEANSTSISSKWQLAGGMREGTIPLEKLNFFGLLIIN